MAAYGLVGFIHNFLILWIILYNCSDKSTLAQEAGVDLVTTPGGDEGNGLLPSSPPDALPEVELNGAGASFPSTVYSRWIPAFKAYRSDYVNLHMTYDAIGSGGGKSRIKGLTEPAVEYAGSDSALSDVDYITYPDLQMFPTMAGAVVLGINLPGIDSINLTRAHVVGIYNGTFTLWNDASIQAVNQVTLPAAEIVVIARADKSGTTELFTSALTAFDNNWAAVYGTFSAGLDDDDAPVYWSDGVIRYYGLTNRGVSGLVLSLTYAIGYLAASDAYEFGIPFALLMNKAGYVVDASVESVQAAMDYFINGFGDRMTSSLSDASSPGAYPIAGYTYFIIHLYNIQDCESATELYRYILWFLYEREPHEECEALHMTPLSPKVADLVIEVLSEMKCQGSYVYVMVEQQLMVENSEAESWRIPVYIAIPFILIIITALAAFYIWQTWKINIALLKEEWRIPSDQMEVEKPRMMLGASMANFSSGMPSRSTSPAPSQMMSHLRLPTSPLPPNLRNSQYSLRESAATAAASSQDSVKTAKWQGLHVTMRWTGMYRMQNIKRNTKKLLLTMKSELEHPNIQRFFGMSELDKKPYLVSEYCPKGCLQDLIVRERSRLDETFKFSLAIDTACGLEYLHKNEIIHGNLSANTCMVDSKWVVKLSDWEYYPISRSQNDRLLQTRPTGDTITIAQDEAAIILARINMAPELILDTQRAPTRAADVYSLALVIYEIFALKPPYGDLLATTEPKCLLDHLLTGELRPQPTDDFLDDMLVLLSQCWSCHPKQRPSSRSVTKQIKHINPSTKSVMDCMMERLEERTAEIRGNMKKFADLLTQMLPSSVADKLVKGEKIEPESFTSVTVSFSDIVGFAELSAASNPFQVVDLLNDLYQTFDVIIDRHQVYKVETICDTYMVVSGLPKRNGINHAGFIADMAFDFARSSIQLKVRHRPKEKLKLRIGMHSGPVLAGVIGVKMPRYCLFGDVVNTSSRMQSTSVEQKIQVSETTHALLQMLGNYITKPRGEVYIKGKGNMKTYFLDGREDRPEDLPEVFKRHIPADVINLKGK